MSRGGFMAYTYENPRPEITVNIIVHHAKSDEILVVKQLEEPFKNNWCLPGGCVNIESDETCKQAAIKHLLNQTGISSNYIRAIGFYDKPSRDPRGRVMSQTYLIDILDEKPELSPRSDSTELRWISYLDVLRDDVVMGFDHFQMVRDSCHLMLREED